MTFLFILTHKAESSRQSGGFVVYFCWDVSKQLIFAAIPSPKMDPKG